MPVDGVDQAVDVDGELAGEAALADAGLAGDGDEARPAVPGRGMKAVLEEAELGLAPDEGRLQAGGPVGPSALGDHSYRPPCGDRGVLALENLGASLLEEDRRARGVPGRLADEHRASRRHGLEAAGGVDQVPGDHSLVRGAHRDGCLAGEDSCPEVQLQPGVAADVAHVGDELEPGPDRALGVVLPGDGRAPDGHDGVADELLDGPAVALDGQAAGLEVAGKELAHCLGVTAGGEGGEADEVGEQDRDVPALGGGVHSGRGGTGWAVGGRGCVGSAACAGRPGQGRAGRGRPGQGRAALAAELRAGGVLGATGRAARREARAALAAELAARLVLPPTGATDHARPSPASPDDGEG